MGRAPCCDKANVKRGSWSAEEDETLKNYIHKHGTAGNWIALPSKAGLRRCGKSCRLRWLNYLRPDIRHGAFTEDEDRIIYTLYSQMGSRWSIIASQLHGRTDNDVKNHWNTKLKKKLLYAATNNNNNHPTTSNVIENYTKKSNFSESKTLLHATPPPLPPPMYLMDVGYGLTVSSGAQNYLVHETAAAASSSRSVSGGNSCSIGFDDKCVSWTTASSNQNNGVLMDDFEGFGYSNDDVNDGGFWSLEEKDEVGGDLNLGDFMYVDPDVKPQGLLQNVINPY